MEPPAKRPRVDATWPDDADDELSFDPFDLPEEEHITSEDEFERAAFDTRNRFQSAMASIFARYDRDFEGIGDEIDLMTEDVVVDNGHLSGMRNEHDTGLADFADEEPEVEGGLRLCDLLDVSLLDGPVRSHAEGTLDDDITEPLLEARDDSTVTNGAAGSAGSPEAKATSLEALTIKPPGYGRDTNGDISPERAAANKARLQGRRSPTPTEFASSIWRLDNTPPKKAAQSNKPATGAKERRHSEPSKAVTRPVASKSSSPKKPSRKAPEPISEKRPPGRPRKTLEVASGNVGTLETRSATSPGLQENADGRRRSNRPSIPVDYLGKVSWSEFEDQRRPTRKTASNPTEQSPEPNKQRQEAHTNSTSTNALVNGYERVIANSQETHIPSSSEISSSTHPSQLIRSSASQSSQLRQSQASQSAHAVRTRQVPAKEQTWENIFDLSDDEMPMPLPAPRAAPKPTAVELRSTIVVELVSKKGSGVVREELVDLNQSVVAEDESPADAAEIEDHDHEKVLDHASKSEIEGREEEDHDEDDGDNDDDDRRIGHTGSSEAAEEVEEQGDTDTAATDVTGAGDISMDDVLPEPDDGSVEMQPQDLAQSPKDRVTSPDQATSPDRANSPDLGTPSHGRTLPTEIPESPNYAQAIPSSSPIKLSSPSKRPLPVEEPELPSPQPSRQSPHRPNHVSLNGQRSSPSTSRAVRLQNYRHAQSPTKLTKSPIKTYDRSPTSRSIWDPRPSPPPPRAHTATAPKYSSPLKKITSKPSTPKTPSYRTNRKVATPSSRHSLLSFTKDRDDVDELSEVIVQTEVPPLRRRGTISGRISHGTSTPRSTGRKARLPYRPRMSMGTKASDMAEVVQSPGGTTRVCGVDGFRCDRDFCFSCL